MNRSEQMIILFYQVSWIQQNDYTAKSMRDCSTCCLSLQLVLPHKGGEVQLKQLSGALCMEPVAPGFAQLPSGCCAKHFLLYVPFFISSVLTYTTFIFLCKKVHCNFSSLPSLNNQQVTVAQISNPEPWGMVRRLLLPITHGAPLFLFHGQL